MKKIVLLLFSIFSFAQQTDKVDFIKCNATVFPDFETRTVNGIVSYDFKLLASIDTIRIDAKGMQFSEVTINGKKVNFKNNNKELLLFEGFKKRKNQLQFNYQATPKQTMYFTGIGEGQQIWTQGQGRYTSHWLPSFDDVNEKVVFNMTLLLTEQLYSTSKFVAISNGVLTEKERTLSWSKGEEYWMYKFKMNKPMSSYLVMLAIGKFEHQTETSQSGIPLENYYKPVDADKYQYTYKDSKMIFDFLEREIGVKYPWNIYRQIPVEDFLYAGMENTSSTIFAQDFVVDESGFNDRNYINVNAHELAHQWFGDIVTAASGKHHWLQEGFATYYALLAERKIFGDDYFYNAMYRNSLLLRKEAKTDTIPILSDKASSYSYYQKGAWALFYLHETIGDKLFHKVIKNYLKKYKFKNVTTSDFLNEVAKVTDFDVVKFQKEWLEDYHFQTEQATTLLKKSEFIRKLFDIQAQKNKPYKDKESYFTEVLKSNDFYALKKEIIYQIVNVPFEEKATLIRLAMQSNEIEVRQSVAETIEEIPLSFQKEYESLLFDKSYDTQQIAFSNLYKVFLDNRDKYLDIAKNWVGKNDKELRILFLTAYINSHINEENNSKTTDYLNELLDYTTPKYESSIRQNAIEYVLEINPKNKIVLKNLINATTHHKWQFAKFAREKIRKLILQEFYLNYFDEILPELNNNEQFQLKRLLDKKN